MAAEHRSELQALAAQHEHVTNVDFTNDMLSYLQAADVVVSMAGYNTVTELLSLNKPALLVPRTTPSLEQWMRATRLERLGLFAVILPDQLSEESMREKILRILARTSGVKKTPKVDMEGLPAVERHARKLLSERQTAGWVRLQQVNRAVNTRHEELPVDVLARPLTTAQQ
jgi:predicted glycosyltransferase